MPTQENQKKGEIFEKYIVSLYEALNFSVTRNINFNGKQIDILAEKIITGVGKTKVLIECKYLSEGSVSNQIVFNYGSYLNSIPKSNYVISGVIISNRDFGKEANLAAISMNVTLMTQDQLESELFQLNESYLRNVREYEQREIYVEYLSLEGIINSGKNILKQIDDVAQEVAERDYNDWKRTKFITLLADFGSGKTTLMQRLNYLFSKKYLEEGILKPIYFELKYFFQYQDIDLFLVGTYKKLFHRDIPLELFWKAVANGEFILLLDGFDEMSPQIDRQIRISNLQLLSRLLLSRSNTIISCRSSYYISDAEFNQSVDELNNLYAPLPLSTVRHKNPEYFGKQKKANLLYKSLINKYTDDTSIKIESEKVNALPVVIEISELSSSQINKYLQKFEHNFQSQCGTSWKEVRDFLYKIYDIKDLLKKPILLSMIKDTMLMMGKDFRENNEVYDPSSLYETYTNANLQRDFKKGSSRQFLSTEQRKQYAELIANAMFEKNTLEVSLAELNGIIKRHASILEKATINDLAELEQVTSDIVLCAFIRRTENNQFKFIHKSFMEFFVARRLKNQLIKHDLKTLKTIYVNRETLYFIGCYANSEEQLMNILVREASDMSGGKQRIILKRNLTIALLLSNSKHHHLQINDARINEVKMANLSFVDSQLANMFFENVELSETVFQNCQELDFGMSNSSIDKIKFISSNLKLQAKGFSATNILMTKCPSIRLNSDNCIFKEIEVIGSNLLIDGSVSFEQANFNLVDIVCSKARYQTLYKPTFKKSTYRVDSGANVSMKEHDGIDSEFDISCAEISIISGKNSTSKFKLNGKTNVQGVFMNESSIEAHGEINIESSFFEAVTFRQKGSLTRFRFEENEFTNCKFIGLTIEFDNLKLFMKHKFTNSYGVIFIENLQENKTSLKFNKIGAVKQKSLFYFDLRRIKPYIPDRFDQELESSMMNDGIFDNYMSRFLK